VRLEHLDNTPGDTGGSATLNGVDAQTDSPAPQRRRADAERNERHIVDAAAEVIWRQPNATIAEVALASGLGRATIYRHFPTRDDLLRGIARHGFEKTAQALRDARPGEGTAVEALMRMIDASVQPANVCMIVLNQLPEPVASEAEKAELLAPVVEALERGVASGELRGDLDIPWTLRAIGALYELAMKELASGQRSREEIVRLMAQSLLEGQLIRP
jgi:AcrR family transcriptional regulator